MEVDQWAGLEMNMPPVFGKEAEISISLELFEQPFAIRQGAYFFRRKCK